MRADFLPLSRPSIGDSEIAAVTTCLRSGWLTSGPRVAEFEEQFARTVGARHAVAVSSATAGLHLALLAAGIGPGDEVVTSPMTWASTGNMILAVGARPVFADIDPGTLNLDPDAAARVVGPRTRALLPVHFAGQPVDLDAFAALAMRHGLVLIEDAAHALGTTYRGRPIGSGPGSAVFSFHPIKAITTGEGGMVTTDDAAVAERLRLLRFHGITRDAWTRYGRRGTPGYEIVALGFKYNMTDLQAALGLTQLARLEEFLDARTRIAGWYRDALASIPTVEMLAPVPYPARHAWHLLVVRLRLEALGVGRDDVIDGLLAANIGVGLHFKALHLHALYRELGFGLDALPHATRASESILSLPLFPAMTPGDVHDVASALDEISKRHAA
ncbi:MAG TPA: aminotransferase class I/II-fold pyridoxal phosphate-dependent enzyme [Verrucomicrobiae bacterium]|nr:aminotransferase class I/II-fold pyridoxal phosphate-dependent enzyme [Verrucomicrobiae bacterium]